MRFSLERQRAAAIAPLQSSNLAEQPAPAGISQGALGWTRKHWAMIAVLALVGLGLAAGGLWFGIAAVLPLLFVLPCAAMLAMCMKSGGTGQKDRGRPDAGS